MKKKKQLFIVALVMIATIAMSVTAMYANDDKKGVTVEGLPEKAATSIESISFKTDKEVKDNKIKVKIERDSKQIYNKDQNLSAELKLKDLTQKDGSYKMTLIGEYKNPNKKFSLSYDFIIDNEKPLVKISGVTDGTITNQDVVVNVSASDNIGIDPAKTSVKLSGEDITNSVLNKDYTISKEGRHTLTVVATDYAGNESTSSVSFTIDKTKPAIDVSGLQNGSYVKALSDLSANMTDENGDRMLLTFIKEGCMPITGSVNGNHISLNKNVEPLGNVDSEAWTMTINAFDKAGNSEVKTITVYKDNVAPAVELGGAEEGKFYNKDMAIKSEVKDAAIKTKAMKATCNGTPIGTEDLMQTFTQEGEYVVTVKGEDMSGNMGEKILRFTIDKTPPVTSVSGIDKGKHYKNPPAVTFTSNEPSVINYVVTRDGKEVHKGSGKDSVSYDKWGSDGDYVVTAYSTDRAGNVGEKISTSFVKDSTAPVISLGGVAEGKYYNTKKSVSISVNERYFKTNKVTVNAYRELNGKRTNIPFSFSSTGQTSVNSLGVSETGNYHITVSAVDEAGNKAKSQSISFTVDTEKPVVKINIAKTTNGFGDVVAPEVTVKEDYMDKKNISLNKSFGEPSKEMPFTDSFSQTGGSRKYADFPKKKANDGVYTVKATVTDKAGNSASVDKTFIVDRFGSIFEIKQYPVKKYQKKLKEDVVIEEVNTGGIKEYKAEVTLDDKTVEASNVAVQKSGYTTTYTIPKENFAKDGIYKVNMVTTDNVGNTSESKKAKDGDKWFAIDNAPPIISYKGVEADRVYKQNSVKMYVESRDTISKSTVSVTSNGDDLKINKDGDRQYVTIPKGINQRVVITAKDKAGNVDEKILNDVTVSSNPFAYLLANKMLMFGLIALIGIIISGGVVAAKKRKQKKTMGDDDIIF